MPLTSLDVATDQTDDFLKSSPAKFFPEVEPIPSSQGKDKGIDTTFLNLVPNNNADNKTYANTPTFYQPKDVSSRYSNFLLGKNNEGINSELQSGWDRVRNSADNLVEKTGAYLAQNVGFLVGAIPSAIGGLTNFANEAIGGEGKTINNGNAISYMTDNFLTNLGDAWKENVQERSPIYKSDKYTNGNIWQKLGTSSWWLDDAVDRLALTAGIFVPGFLEAKGVGLFGAAIDEAGVVKGTGLITKGIQALSDNPELYGKLGKTLGNQIYKTAVDGSVDIGGALKDSNIAAQTFERAAAFKDIIQKAQAVELIGWNATGQSALNAREAQTGIRKELKSQREQGLNSLSDDEIESKAAEGAAKGFWYTAPLSLITSYTVVPQIFSSAKMGESALLKFFNSETGQQLEGALEKTVKPTIPEIVGKVLKTGLISGQSESAQVAVGRYLEESIAGKTIKNKDDNYIVQKDENNPFLSIFKNWIDNVNDPNGSNNIALGTIQGIIESLAGHGISIYKGEYTHQDENNRNFINSINKGMLQRNLWTMPENFMQTTINGKPDLNEDSSPKWDANKLTQMGVSLLGATQAYNDRIQAIQAGDKQKLDELNHQSLASLSHNFFDDPKGMEYLTNVLRFEAKNQTENINRENDSSNGIEQTPNIKLQQSLEYVEQLKKAYDAIENRHAGFTALEFDRTNKEEASSARNYIENLKYAQYQNAAKQIYLNNTISKNNTSLLSTGITDLIEEPSSPQEEKANSIINENKELIPKLEETKNEYKLLTNRDIFRANWELEKNSAIRAEKTIADIKEKSKQDEENIGKTISIKTKDGEEEIEIGTPYYLGRVVEKSEGGKDVYRAPILTVLGENENGTIRIKSSNGEERDISKQELESYKLGRVSDTLNNKKAKFFMENWNSIFQFNFGKGNKVTGRLEYSPKNGILNFVYKNKKGETKSIEVTGDQFVAKKGYNSPMIEKTGTLSAVQQKSLEDFSKEKDERIDKKKEIRLKILSDLFNTTSDKLEKTKELIENKKSSLEKLSIEFSELEKKIEEGKLTKKEKFSSVTKKAISTINSLSKTRDALQKEIQTLSNEQEDLEFHLSYISDMSQNIDELPTDGKDFLEELHSQVDDLKSLHEETEKQISSLSKLIDGVESTLKKVVNLAIDLINKFKKQYPNTLFDSTELANFLNKNIEETNPEYIANIRNILPELFEFAKDFSDIGDIQTTFNEKIVGELRKQLEELQEPLSEIEKELNAKKLILDRFQEVADEYKKQKEEEEKSIKDEKLLQQFLGTFSNDVQPIQEGKDYEPASKKSPLNVIGSTINPNDQKSFNVRANNFGYKFHSLKNVDNIRGIIVTQKTEDEILPGLTQHLIQGSTADPSSIITLVMVEQHPDGSYFLINENGEPITEDALNKAIYQVFPLSKLEATYNGQKESMFPKDTPENVETSLREQYDGWRKEILSREELGDVEDINSSFGIPEYVTHLDDKGKEIPDYDAQVPLEDTGLISNNSLQKERIIEIATTNESISNGSVTFNTPKGRVFLRAPGGLVKLFNKKLDSKKANNIFNVLHQLSKNITGEEGIRSENSKKLIEYLKSVIYWGIAHDQDTGKRKLAGYNNIWFEKVRDEDYAKDVYKLFISGKGEGFYFTPSSLENNKENILLLLNNMFHNTNASLVNDNKFNAPYYEIVSIDEEGNPIPKKWDNYQTYLLSKEGRSPNEIPLTTYIRPLKNKEDVNRKGIYFTLKSTPDNYVIPKEQPIIKIAKKGPQLFKETTSPTEATPTPSKENNASTGFILDGETKNVIENPVLGKIVFAATKEGKIKFFEDKEGNLDEDTQKAIDVLASQKNITKEKAKDVIGASILQKIKPQIIAEEIPEQPPISPPSEESAFRKRKRNLFNPDDTAYRLQLNKEIKKFEGENWEKFESFLKEKFPNLPVYRVKNIIQATNGRQAWGMLQDGAIYVYDGAEIGTGYHEVFEAVWKMFSPYKEQQSIINEFKQRKGSFQDRISGEKINYSEASPQDIKEELAEEFRDYILKNKNVSSPVAGKSFIERMFHDLLNFIKEFFTGNKAQKNTQELFEKIGNGYYKEYIPYETQLSYATKGIQNIEYARANEDSELRLKIPSTQSHEIMQQMTYSLLTSLTRNNKSLFSIPKLNKESLYSTLKEEILSLIGHQGDLIEQAIDKKEITTKEATQKYNDVETLYNNVNDEWKEIINKHEEYLKSYSIEFDENGESILTDEDNSGKSDYQDARKIDSFRNMNSSIRLLLATLPEVEINNKNISIVRSSIGGVRLIPSDKTYITLMNALYESKNVDEMLEKLRILSINNPNYIALYSRITKSDYKSQGVEWENLKNTYDVQLLSGIWKTFKKQNADVKTVFIFPTGEVEFSDSSLSTAARQSKWELFNDVISKIKSDSPYVSYNSKTKKYEATPLVKSYKLDSGKIDTYIAFLKGVGINFSPQELRKLSNSQLNTFRKATEGIRESVSKYKDVVSFNKKSLNIEGNLLQLGTIKAVLSSPEFESTYFNINGDRVQTFLGVNAISNLYDVISKLKNINELSGTPYSYLLTDVFSKGSSLLDKMFTIDGERISGTEQLLHYGMVDGIINESTNKEKEASRLTYKERIIQELNANYNGWYMNLVPGDASIEGMLYLGNPISTQMLGYGFNEVEDVFKNYFISEVGLSRENRKIVKIGDRKSTDLRFFKPILGDSLHNEIIKNTKLSQEELYDKYKKEINSSIKEFINEDVKERRNSLSQYGILYYDEEGMKIDGLAFAEEGDITEEALELELKALSINYMMGNIELHKLIYSDPYQYKDELKRIKNFGSPRQGIISNSSNIGELMNRIYNKNYSPDDIGYSDMSEEHMNSVSIDDVFSSNELYPIWNETDGGGYIFQKANRKFRIRAADWTDENEQQYRYDIAYEKFVKNIPLTEEEKKFNIKRKDNKIIGDNPDVRSTYTPLKPIVTGNKDDGNNYNDIAVHKFALVPLSFRILHELSPNSNALKFYEKGQIENVDYALYNSSAKVGAGELSSLYNDKGEFNTLPFKEINKIPFSIISVQSEVPSKDSPVVTQGSQITKLATLDFLEAGIPIDYNTEQPIEDKLEKWYSLSEEEKLSSSEIYREIKNNQNILEARIEEGYSSLLKKLGISKINKGFEISNIDKLINTLSNEILKREVNDNITDAFRGFKNGDVVLEATPAYQQIRNILYSISDRNVVRPKISGGLKVQIPSTLLESNRIAIKEINGKQAYTSDILKFYEDEDGKRVCEIMIAKWFSSSMPDDELIDYLNNTEEGQKVLSGIGFRIPTQKQNSIEVFKIKKFLPNGFGDSVVVPSALVNKVGSDFDIDKLSIYLKNIYKDAKTNKIKPIPYFGTGEEAKQKIKDFLIKEDITHVLLAEVETNTENVEDDYDTLADKFYAKSLENEYIDSLEKLVSHPLNFKQLTKPNSAEQLETLSDNITSLMGEKQFDYSSTGAMLSIKAMSSLRQAFVTGKQAIGIAAVNQTNHSQNQRANIFIDKNRLDGDKINDIDKKWLGDGQVNFPKFNKLNGNPSLSFIKNADGEYISDLIGQFIDGYVDVANGPWIMQLGAKPNVASTWLFLIKLGVPIDTVAYFMNQPIVRDYLRNIESKGYSWLFIDDIFKDAQDSYKPQSQIVVKNIPSEKDLKDMLPFNKIGERGKLSEVQKAQQQFILQEFVKYAKMAEHLFHVTQGSNFDTATINDPYIVFKKQQQLIKAQNTIISSVDDLLNNSFVGKLKDTIYNIRDAFSTILISDRKNVRNVIEKSLLPYVDMNDGDFTKLAQKTVNDMFDWAVQNDRQLNTQIKNILLSQEDKQSTAEEIIEFANKVKGDKNHPLHNNIILNSLKRITGSKILTPDNLQIIGRDNKVYDQNQIIYAFNELKNNLGEEGTKMYGKLIHLAVLQSGLTKSGISFTSLIPYKDFKEIYNETLSALENSPIIDKFNELNVLQRNNWNNSDIVPNMKAKWIKSKKGDWFYNINVRFLNNNIKNAINRGEIPQIVKISQYSREGASDFITYSWENKLSSNKEKNKQLKKEARKNGDNSYINRYLLKKVYNSDGSPLLHISQTGDKIYTDYVYKAINAWGYSYKANEFYSLPIPSVIDNDFKKIVNRTETEFFNDEPVEIKYSGETDDSVIEDIVNKKTKLKTQDFKC